MRHLLRTSLVGSFGVCLGILLFNFFIVPETSRSAHAQSINRVTDLGHGVYVVDVRDKMGDATLGWAPLLVEFLHEHPDRRVTSMMPASVSGGRGTMNSVVLLTEPK